MAKIFHAADKIFKQQAKKMFLGSMWKSWPKKLRFFCARSFLKIDYLAPKAPSEQFWGWSAKKGCRKVIPKLDPLEKCGNQNWGRAVVPAPHPLGTLLIIINVIFV